MKLLATLVFSVLLSTASASQSDLRTEVSRLIPDDTLRKASLSLLDVIEAPRIDLYPDQVQLVAQMKVLRHEWNYFADAYGDFGTDLVSSVIERLFHRAHSAIPGSDITSVINVEGFESR